MYMVSGYLFRQVKWPREGGGFSCLFPQSGSPAVTVISARTLEYLQRTSWPVDRTGAAAPAAVLYFIWDQLWIVGQTTLHTPTRPDS